MLGEWMLRTNLNGEYKVTKWQTQEGAIADRERMLKPRRVKNTESPTGYRMVYPIGWTAITKVRNNG